MQFQHPSRGTVLSEWIPRAPHLPKESPRRDAGKEATTRGGASSRGTTGRPDDGEVEGDRKDEGRRSRYDQKDRTRADALPGLCPTEAGDDIVPRHQTQIARDEIYRAILPTSLSGLDGSGTRRIQEGVSETKAEGWIRHRHPIEREEGDSEEAVHRFAIGEREVE